MHISVNKSIHQIHVHVYTYSGITLTRSHSVVLLDRAWTPGDTNQAEDRVRRIGQKSMEVESIWIEAFDLDKKLDSLLESKSNNTDRVLCSKEVLLLKKQENDIKNESIKNSTYNSKENDENENGGKNKTLYDFFNSKSQTSNKENINNNSNNNDMIVNENNNDSNHYNKNNNKNLDHNNNNNSLHQNIQRNRQSSNEDNLGFGQTNDNEDDQTSIMKLLFKHIIK